ncbi:MAG: hypothetical protein JW729_06845 [Bacteroidales bacterium]|nr:hypothetical protein [Bacteroidales bacterium]
MQIVIHNTGQFLYLQFDSIFHYANVQVENKYGEVMIQKSAKKTNFIAIEINLPKGNYLIKVLNGDQKWKRQIFI